MMPKPASFPLFVVALGSLTLPPAGRAATVGTIPVALTDTTLATLSRADCELPADKQQAAELQITWTTSTIPANTGNQVLDVFIGKASDNCALSSALKKLVENEATGTAPRTSFPVAGDAAAPTPADLFALASPTATCGGATGVNQDLFVCVQAKTPATVVGGTDTITTGSAQITVDSVPPPTPTDTKAESLDGGLRVTWSMPSDVGNTARFKVFAKPATGDEKQTTIDGATSRTTDITGLTNGTEYTVTVSSVDNFGSSTRGTLGNESPRSVPAAGTPQPVEDFYQRYRRLGGTETGGCAGAPAGLAALAGLALLLRRRHAAWLLLIPAVLAPPAARAQTAAPPGTLASIIEQSRSPQHYSLELRTGPFLPGVDDEFRGAATPFKDVFGTNSPWMVRLELDYNPLDRPNGWDIGLLSVGVSAGFWQADGKARRLDDTTALDGVSLRLWPLGVHLSYRADMLWRAWHVPLVPYGKAGWGFVNWECRRQTGDAVCKSGGQEGSGWADGLEWTAGALLVLDVFDQEKAAQLDQDYGINATTVFVQYADRSWRGAHGLRLNGGGVETGLALFF